jgi:hypothetical protein
MFLAEDGLSGGNGDKGKSGVVKQKAVRNRGRGRGHKTTRGERSEAVESIAGTGRVPGEGRRGGVCTVAECVDERRRREVERKQTGRSNEGEERESTSKGENEQSGSASKGGEWSGNSGKCVKEGECVQRVRHERSFPHRRRFTDALVLEEKQGLGPYWALNSAGRTTSN